MRLTTALVLALALAGCAVNKAALAVSKDLAADCAKHCDTLEMRLTAVVVVAGSGGCVCEPRSAPATQDATRTGAAGAAAGGAVVAAQAAAAQAQSTQNQAPSTAPTSH